MGRRRRKNDSEQAIFWLIVLSALYLTATHRWTQVVGGVLAGIVGIGVLGFVAVIVVKRLRPPSPPRGENAREVASGRREPTLSVREGSPFVRDRTPDVLDRIRDQRAAERQRVESAKSTAWSLVLIRALEWKRFEELCEGFWKAKGYRAEPTGRGADGGIDIHLYRPSDPNKLLAVIQCKSRAQNSIGVAVVRELFGVMHHVNAPMGILMASSGFHPPARAFAVGKHLQLIDGESLLKRLLELPAETRDALLAHVTRGDYITPTCPSCDEKMVVRTSKARGTEFFGCPNYPRGCQQTFYPRTDP